MVVGAGRNILGGGEEMSGGDNDKIGDGLGGGFGCGIERGIRRRGGVSGSKRVEWSVMEQGGGQISDQPRQITVREQVREVGNSKNLNLEGQSLVLL